MHEAAAPLMARTARAGPTAGDPARHAGSIDVYALFRLANQMRDAFSKRMKHERWAVDAGFRPPCVGALTVIGRLQPVSQREVSRHLSIDPADLVEVIDILEAAGLVVRERDMADRRRYALSLTKAGTRRLARVEAIRQTADDDVFGTLTPVERTTLARLMTKALDRSGHDGGRRRAARA